MSQLLLLAFSMLLPAITQDAPASAAPKVHKIAVGGEGGWDYLTVDADGRRLYVSRGNRVTVLDLDTEAVVGELADTPGVHRPDFACFRYRKLRRPIYPLDPVV